MKSKSIVALVAFTIACGPPKLGGDASTSNDTTSSADATGSVDVTGSAETTGVADTTSTSISDSDTDPCPDTDTLDAGTCFVPTGDWADEWGDDAECDPFAQDCPDGEKCVPFASTAVEFDANKCVMVMGDQPTDEPCTYGGIVEATDDCDASGICWDVMDVDGMLIGDCYAFCGGTLDDPVCPDGDMCFIAGEASLTICIPRCDPLTQGCEIGEACYWADSGFGCVFMDENTPPGDPCEDINSCALGSVCLTADVLPMCDGSACCTPWCDVGLGDAQCVAMPGTSCVPFFEQGMAPQGDEDVGVCILAP